MRRALCLFLALAALLALCGCASLFEREDYLVEDYELPGESLPEEEDSADTISNYAGLRRAIVRLVSEHAESAILQFQNYEGSIQQDISTACWEVKSSTALGAFAVDYISYDLSRIVSYYQAEIHITYKRAAYQVEAVERVSGRSALETRLDEALRNGETYLALEYNIAAVSTDVVRAAVEDAYYADPLACPVLPEAEIGVFPESGVSHILEITLDYGLEREELGSRREELTAAVEAVLADTSDEEAAHSELLAGLCDRLADMFVTGGGSTAWDALVQGTADSEGAAMAFAACAQSLGYDCIIVSGRLDGEPHCWNIIRVGAGTYHLDISTWHAEEQPVFLFDDEAMISGGYWWDTGEYPVCADPYTDEDPSTEPGREAPGSDDPGSPPEREGGPDTEPDA